MDLLLYTNAFLWFCEDNPKLSSTAKQYIENQNNTSFRAPDPISVDQQVTYYMSQTQNVVN